MERINETLVQFPVLVPFPNEELDTWAFNIFLSIFEKDIKYFESLFEHEIREYRLTAESTELFLEDALWDIADKFLRIRNV
jgi:hypothetical protein